jgi:hypothetical protein
MMAGQYSKHQERERERERGGGLAPWKETAEGDFGLVVRSVGSGIHGNEAE